MSLDFGKLNFSTSFNPTAAFPLDARSYFETLAAAEAAAKTAVIAGSADSVYYFGQTLAVVENNYATLYIIQPDKSLQKVGNDIEINPSVFEYDEDGKINLKGFSKATIGAQLVIGADGNLAWVLPDETTADGLSTSISTLRNDFETLKNNIYTKEQVNQQIAAVSHIKRMIVNSYGDIQKYDDEHEDGDRYIFMVPDANASDHNKYLEYIIVSVIDNDNVATRFIEQIGTWEISLENYVTDDDLADELEKFIQKSDDARLITLEEANKLANLVNYITSVSNKFSVINGVLDLVTVPMTIVEGLKTALDNKVSIEEGYGLTENNFSDELKNKLENINVTDLNLALTRVKSLIADVYDEYNSDGEVQDKGLMSRVLELETIVSNLDSNTETLNNLSSTVEGFSSIISSLDTTYVKIADFNTVVGNLDKMLEDKENILADIKELKDALLWQELENDII